METIYNSDIIKIFNEEGIAQCISVIRQQAPHFSTSSIRNSVNRLVSNHRQINKSTHRTGLEPLENFMKTTYTFPSVKGPNTNKKPTGPGDDPEVYKKVASDIAYELKKTEDLLKVSDNKLIKQDIQRRQLMNDNVVSKSDLNKSISENIELMEKVESDKTILNVKTKVLEEVEAENTSMHLNLENVHAQLKRKQLQVKATKGREVYHRAKVSKLESVIDNQVKDDDSELIQEIERLTLEVDSYKQEIKGLKEENDYLKDLISDNSTLTVFDEDKNVYLPNIQKCVYELLTNHVPSNRVSNAIQAVLNLGGMKANRLPSTSTVQNMNLQRLALSQKQIGDTVCNSESTTLYTDETSKYGNKVCGYHIRDKEGTYFTLGLRDLTTKSGKDTLETFKEILNDIDKVADDEANDTSKQILTNIRSTMSDSASTEIKFNELLEEYRSTVLPYTVANYSQLDDASKKSVDTLVNFFCGLHSLVHFAETSSKSLLAVEKEIFNDKPPIHDPSFKKPTESGTTRLIRTACKSFARGADEKSGCHIQFVTQISDFMKEKHIRTLKLVPYRGHRFNILFHNAGQVYMLHLEMVKFLEGYNLNRLTQSVLHDLQEPVYISGCKALGLISKLISTPLWHILEDKTIHILEMNKYYLMLANGLKDAALNIPQFMLGQSRPFGNEVAVKEDCVYESLVAESQYDNVCETILHVVLPALSQYVQRKFVDFLPSGKFADSTEEQKEVCLSVDKHNKFSERVFAYYDNLLRFKPHISTLASEAYIVFTLNKTKEWLDTKTDNETEKIVAEARHKVKELRQKFKVRSNLIIAKRQEKLNEQRRANEAAAERKLNAQEKMTDEIIYYGLWQSEDQIDTNLLTYNTPSAKINSLKSQLRFRKEVLKQRTGDAKVYNFTHVINEKRVNLTVIELTTNLKTLVQHAFLTDSQKDKPEETHIILGKRVRHKFTEKGADKWYYGKVISQVPGYPAWYNITYDDDTAVYSYQLLKDYQDKCLELCV